MKRRRSALDWRLAAYGWGLTACRSSVVLLAIASTATAQIRFRSARPVADTGHYQPIIDSLSKIAPTDSEWLPAQRELVRTLAMVGRYDDAERVGRHAASDPRGTSVKTALGEVLMARGKVAAADSEFTQ